MAGIERALFFAQQQQCDRVALVPCDSPQLPQTLVQRLNQAMEQSQAALAFATVDGRDQPLFCLLRTHLHGDLVTCLQARERKVLRWLERFELTRVHFPMEETFAFANFNTPEDLVS